MEHLGTAKAHRHLKHQMGQAALPVHARTADLTGSRQKGGSAGGHKPVQLITALRGQQRLTGLENIQMLRQPRPVQPAQDCQFVGDRYQRGFTGTNLVVCMLAVQHPRRWIVIYIPARPRDQLVDPPVIGVNVSRNPGL